MKPIHAATIAALILAAPFAHAERFMVMRQAVTLASGPDDDMRPQIVGTVVAVDAGGVTLEGGARVAATGAKPGDLATFACQDIDQGSPPTSRGCVLIRAEHPQPKGDAVDLWH